MNICSQIRTIAQVAYDSGVGYLFVGLSDDFEEGNWKYIGSGQNFDDSGITAWNWTDGDLMHNYDTQNCAAAQGENLICDVICNDTDWHKYGLCEIKTNLC